MATEDAEIRRKHHRSPEDELEERSKRRKHSHRHHHHHRRHRSKKCEHESKNEEDDLKHHHPSSSAVVVSGSNCRRDDDKEEGEILEEEEEEERSFDLLKKKIAESDVESGEIKPDELGEKHDSRNLGIHENGYTSFDKAPDKAELNLNDLPGGISPVGAGDETECSDGKDAKKVHDEDDAPEDSRGEHLTFNGKENGRGKNEQNAGKELGKSSENKREKRSSDSSCEDRRLALVTEDFGHKFDEGALTMLKDSESSLEGIEKKKNYKDVGEGSSEKKGRSRTTSAKEDIDSRSHRKMDDRVIRMDHSRYAEDWNSSRASKSLDFDRSSLGNQNKSMSSEKEEEKYEFVAHSPSRDKYHDEAHIRSRSRSSDHARHRRSRSRSHVQDGRAFYEELDIKSYSDANDRAKLFGSREKTSYDSDHERVVGYDREERRGSRDRERERERERSSSYSRHSVREDRNESHERERWRERKREHSRSHSRQSVQQGRYDSRENERGRERNRERSSSYSRYSMLEDRNGSRDRERERDRAREREREKERERQSEKERERGREREKERRRIEGGDKDKDLNSARDRHRDRGRDIEKERGRNENYSRRSKHNELEHCRDRTRLKDQSGISSSIKDKFEVEEGKLDRDEEEQEDYEEKIALKLAEQEEEDVDRIKEESRKRRQAILEKYKQQQLQKQVQPKSDGPGEEKGSFTVDKLIVSSSPKTVVSAASEGLPTRDDSVNVPVADPLFSVEKSPMQNGISALERTHGSGGLGDGSPKSERSMDMFSDDIFGESPAGVRKMGKGDSVQVERSGLNDNWDDAEGYYSYRFGEVLDGRYEIIAAHGKGVFSTVVRAKDLKAGKGDPEEVAIKIIRNNDTMYKAGLEELVILKKLAAADPLDRRHCVRFLSSFKYRNHLCLVFESLHMNLREVLKKFGRNIGLKLAGVRAYAKQLFIALKHLRNCSVLHCDIKPDNMLVNEAKNVLKLCDFGNAMFAGKNEITPYLVSRFYRAPEIILGLAYDHPMDIWSVGCCLYELYSGKVLFPGPSNSDMLRLHMELKGPFPKKMLRKGAFTDQHFDQDLNFHAIEEDPVTKKAVKRLLVNIKPKDIGALITGYPGEDPKMLANFKDLLEKIFVLDPEKRMTVSQALNHPFITGK